jgi:hypothetical protein
MNYCNSPDVTYYSYQVNSASLSGNNHADEHEVSYIIGLLPNMSHIYGGLNLYVYWGGKP